MMILSNIEQQVIQTNKMCMGKKFAIPRNLDMQRIKKIKKSLGDVRLTGLMWW